MKLKLIQTVIKFSWFTAHSIVRTLPLPFSFKLAEIISFFLSLRQSPLKQHMFREIKIIFPEKSDTEIARIIRESFAIFSKRQVEVLILGSMGEMQVCQHTRLSGEKHVQHALRQGKGGIILLSHFGSFLMALPALHYRGYKINQLVGPTMINSGIQQTVFDLRKNESDKLPIHFYHSDQSMRQVVRALHNNELVALAFDGREGNHWEKVDFLNQSANIASGFLRLAEKTGAAIIPTFVVRREHAVHEVCFEDPVFVPEYTNRDDYYHQTTQELAGLFESYINKYPDHFVMTLARLKEDSDKNLIDVPFFNEPQTSRGA